MLDHKKPQDKPQCHDRNQSYVGQYCGEGDIVPCKEVGGQLADIHHEEEVGRCPDQLFLAQVQEQQEGEDHRPAGSAQHG